MARIRLAAASRQDKGKKVQTVRASGDTPGVIYGHGTKSAVIAVDSKQLERVYHEAGSNKIIELTIDKDTTKSALFHDVQHHPLTGRLLHFDLYEIKMDEAIETEVPIHYLGEAPAVYNQGGVLLKSLDAVEVKALPLDLPESIEVNLEELEEVNDAVHISDLKVDSAVTILNDPDAVVTQVVPPKTEEELEAELEEEVPEDAEAAVESEHGGEAEEGEETAEGEEPAEDEDKGEAEAKEADKEAKPEEK